MYGGGGGGGRRWTAVRIIVTLRTVLVYYSRYHLVTFGMTLKTGSNRVMTVNYFAADAT